MLATSKRFARRFRNCDRRLKTTRYARILAHWDRQDANSVRLNGHRSEPKDRLAVRIEYMSGRWIYRSVRDEAHARRIVRGIGLAKQVRFRQPVKMIRSTANL